MSSKSDGEEFVSWLFGLPIYWLVYMWTAWIFSRIYSTYILSLTQIELKYWQIFAILLFVAWFKLGVSPSKNNYSEIGTVKSVFTYYIVATVFVWFFC